jgi:hypothetical protein
MDTPTSIQESSNQAEYSNLAELMAATDIKTGNYVLPLYGFKIFIHQKPSTGNTNNTDSTKDNIAKITAYQTDNQGSLHFIDDIYVGQYVSQLSISADGRYFGFITIDDGITTGYVYYLDVLAREIDIAHSWSYIYCPNPKLVFSQNGQFAIFSPGANKLQIQSLYSDEPEAVFETSAEETTNGTLMAANLISLALSYDYLVWMQSTGKLVVIDLVADQRPTEWPDINIQLAPNFASCMFYNDYLVHIYHNDEKSAATISLLQINQIIRTVSVSNQFEFPELGQTWCVLSMDGKSITLHNYHKHRETRMFIELPKITTCLY